MRKTHFAVGYLGVQWPDAKLESKSGNFENAPKSTMTPTVKRRGQSKITEIYHEKGVDLILSLHDAKSRKKLLESKITLLKPTRSRLLPTANGVFTKNRQTIMSTTASSIPQRSIIASNGRAVKQKSGKIIQEKFKKMSKIDETEVARRVVKKSTKKMMGKKKGSETTEKPLTRIKERKEKSKPPKHSEQSTQTFAPLLLNPAASKSGLTASSSKNEFHGPNSLYLDDDDYIAAKISAAEDNMERQLLNRKFGAVTNLRPSRAKKGSAELSMVASRMRERRDVPSDVGGGVEGETATASGASSIMQEVRRMQAWYSDRSQIFDEKIDDDNGNGVEAEDVEGEEEEEEGEGERGARGFAFLKESMERTRDHNEHIFQLSLSTAESKDIENSDDNYSRSSANLPRQSTSFAHTRAIGSSEDDKAGQELQQEQNALHPAEGPSSTNARPLHVFADSISLPYHSLSHAEAKGPQSSPSRSPKPHVDSKTTGGYGYAGVHSPDSKAGSLHSSSGKSIAASRTPPRSSVKNLLPGSDGPRSSTKKLLPGSSGSRGPKLTDSPTRSPKKKSPGTGRLSGDCLGQEEKKKTDDEEDERDLFPRASRSVESSSSEFNPAYLTQSFDTASTLSTAVHPFPSWAMSRDEKDGPGRSGSASLRFSLQSAAESLRSSHSQDVQRDAAPATAAGTWGVVSRTADLTELSLSRPNDAVYPDYNDIEGFEGQLDAHGDSRDITPNLHRSYHDASLRTKHMHNRAVVVGDSMYAQGFIEFSAEDEVEVELVRDYIRAETESSHPLTPSSSAVIASSSSRASADEEEAEIEVGTADVGSSEAILRKSSTPHSSYVSFTSPFKPAPSTALIDSAHGVAAIPQVLLTNIEVGSPASASDKANNNTSASSSLSGSFYSVPSTQLKAPAPSAICTGEDEDAEMLKMVMGSEYEGDDGDCEALPHVEYVLQEEGEGDDNDDDNRNNSPVDITKEVMDNGRGVGRSSSLEEFVLRDEDEDDEDEDDIMKWVTRRERGGRRGRYGRGWKLKSIPCSDTSAIVSISNQENFYDGGWLKEEGRPTDIDDDDDSISIDDVLKTYNFSSSKAPSQLKDECGAHFDDSSSDFDGIDVDDESLTDLINGSLSTRPLESICDDNDASTDTDLQL